MLASNSLCFLSFFQYRFPNAAAPIQILSVKHVFLLQSWLQILAVFRSALQSLLIKEVRGPVRMLDPLSEQLVTNDEDATSQPRLLF